ncbi:MAG: TetR/AcrR family transcriptional regulator [Lachnospiraceae bacterium]|nr:TetR/AcrR family transcriptional regulator [Lachnospiraceae bacterium]
MPKIIQNLEKRLIEEAIRQIEEVGYSGMTIRSVAKACEVGVGTVYNYFPSKDDLLATYLLKDWNDCITAINAVSDYSETSKPVARCIYDQLSQYALRHRSIFRDDSAAASFAGSFGRYHGLLRGQLAAPLRKFCDSDFSAEFVAEALLTWTMAETPFEEIYGMIEKLLI